MQNYSTLDLILKESHGALLVSLKKTAGLIGLEAQTIRNQIYLKKCVLMPVRLGRNVFFKANDIADLIDSSQPLETSFTKKRGRPSKSEIMAGRK